jgi:hypothetical protein
MPLQAAAQCARRHRIANNAQSRGYQIPSLDPLDTRSTSPNEPWYNFIRLVWLFDNQDKRITDTQNHTPSPS